MTMTGHCLYRLCSAAKASTIFIYYLFNAVYYLLGHIAVFRGTICVEIYT